MNLVDALKNAADAIASAQSSADDLAKSNYDQGASDKAAADQVTIDALNAQIAALQSGQPLPPPPVQPAGPSQADFDAMKAQLDAANAQIASMQATIAGIPDQVAASVKSSVESLKAQDLVKVKALEAAIATLEAEFQPVIDSATQAAQPAPDAGAQTSVGDGSSSPA